jgi:hypothetical protein
MLWIAGANLPANLKRVAMGAAKRHGQQPKVGLGGGGVGVVGSPKAAAGKVALTGHMLTESNRIT